MRICPAQHRENRATAANDGRDITAKYLNNLLFVLCMRSCANIRCTSHRKSSNSNKECYDAKGLVTDQAKYHDAGSQNGRDTQLPSIQLKGE